jgi:hypothetical protein
LALQFSAIGFTGDAILKKILKRLSFQTFFTLDRLGLHVLPKHYYTPIPDYSWLRTTEKHGKVAQVLLVSIGIWMSR